MLSLRSGAQAHARAEQAEERLTYVGIERYWREVKDPGH